MNDTRRVPEMPVQITDAVMVLFQNHNISLHPNRHFGGMETGNAAAQNDNTRGLHPR